MPGNSWIEWTIGAMATIATMALALGCAGGSDSGPDLSQRAYVISKEHDELTVIDLRSMDIIGRVATLGVDNHMAELNADFTKVYVDSSETHETIVIDARTLQILKRIPVGKHPAHLTLSPDGKLLAVMAEDDNAIVFIDTATDTIVKTLPGFSTPHFLRFTPDGRYGYVANIGAHHLTRVDIAKLEIESNIALEGFTGRPIEALDEGGFADAQIDRNGILYAAHHATGRVLVYDTKADKKLPELMVGKGPWVVFAEHPFANLPMRHLVANFQDRTMSLIDGLASTVAMTLPGDEEAYGVNFSSRTPGKAFVMNRIRQDVAVVDTTTGAILNRIPVGGNTETASTTADGRHIIAAVSGANRVVVIDPETAKVTKAFENVGKYPWSVTIPNGQNYCH
jgi:YVTN family beta-propeller protein